MCSSKIPIVSFIGWSGSGKTTFIEGLIPELKSRGLRVAVVKHDAHKFDLDREGKDTWRFANAGAEAVAISSPEKAAVMYYRPVELDELLGHISGVDLIIVEGWKSSSLPKIEVHRLANEKPMYESPKNLLALVTDAHIQTDTPVFTLSDYTAMADFLVKCLSVGTI